MTASGWKRIPNLWLLPLEEAFAGLVSDGVLVPHEVEGLKGPWYVHRDLLADRRPFRGRTTVLSPFDPLIYDRTRAERLWGFRYKLEIYVPADKREYGYYVLPILHGDRVGADRRRPRPEDERPPRERRLVGGRTAGRARRRPPGARRVGRRR